MIDNKKKIQELWNACNKDYDKHMNKTDHYTAQEKILKLLSSNLAEPILDLACGIGFLINLLLNKFSKVFGNDFSSEMAKIAKDKTSILITTNNAETLESYNNKFKTIISCNLFFYLQNRKKAIKRWAKSLEANGKIIFIEEFPFIKPESKEMDKHTEELMNLINPISPKEIEKIMVQNEFYLIKKVETKIDEKHKLYGLVFSLK